MHALRFVSDDFHRSRRIHPCSPQIGACGMSQIVKSEIRNARTTTRLIESGLNISYWLVFVQEDMLGVQSPLLPELSEDPVHLLSHRDGAGRPILGIAKRELTSVHVHVGPFET